MENFLAGIVAGAALMLIVFLLSSWGRVTISKEHYDQLVKSAADDLHDVVVRKRKHRTMWD